MTQKQMLLSTIESVKLDCENTLRAYTEACESNDVVREVYLARSYAVKSMIYSRLTAQIA